MQIKIKYLYINHWTILQGSFFAMNKKFICKGANPKILSNSSCSLRLANRTVQFISFRLDIVENVTLKTLHVSHILRLKKKQLFVNSNYGNYELFQARINTYYKYSTVYRRAILSTDLDMCMLYKKEGVSSVNNMFPSDYININGCPLKGTLKVENMVCDFSNAFDVFPSGNWRLDMELYTKRGTKEVSIITAQLFTYINYIGNKTEF